MDFPAKQNRPPDDGLSVAQKLFSLRSAYGTCISTSTAVNALISVDCVSVACRDSFYGASVCASAAADALFSIDFISHW